MALPGLSASALILPALLALLLAFLPTLLSFLLAFFSTVFPALFALLLAFLSALLPAFLTILPASPVMIPVAVAVAPIVIASVPLALTAPLSTAPAWLVVSVSSAHSLSLLLLVLHDGVSCTRSGAICNHLPLLSCSMETVGRT
jgi:hypothetical protein